MFKLSSEKLDAAGKIKRAKIAMREQNPFFARLVLSIKENEAKEGMFPKGNETMGIDAFGNMIYSKDFVEKLEEQELCEVVLHETLHMAFNHMIRRGKRDHALFNVCNDVIVNQYIIDEFKDKYGSWIEKNGITAEKINQQFPKANLKDVKKMTSEELYDILWKIIPKTKVVVFGDSKDQGYGKQFDKHSDINDMPDKEKKELEEKYGKSFDEIKQDIANENRRRLVDAYSRAKMKGDVPDGLEQLFDKLQQSKMKWKTIMYKYVSQTIPRDFTWARPSKKSIAVGVYLPTTTKQSVDIIVTVDTSGSVWESDVNQFLSECIHIAKAFDGINMVVLTHDVKVQDTIEVHNGNINKLLNMKVHGAGGTSHHEVFKWIEDNKPNAKLIISLTDGFSDIETLKDTGIPTLWILSPNHNDKSVFKFGQVFELED